MNKCIRIEYKDEFHLDLVLIRNIEPCPAVTDYLRDEWIESDPVAFDDWIHETNQETKDKDDGPTYLLQTIRHVREWALEQFNDSMRPSGIFLSTFVGRHHALTRRVHNRGLECQFTSTHHRRDPGAILADTARIMLGCWRNKGADKSTLLPVRPHDDLTAGWGDSKQERFEQKLEELVQKSRKAAKPETSDEEAAEVWHELFGTRFPRNG